jgi:hypothetical protein
MNFELPATGTELSPAFLNAIACQDWLVTVPLANAVQAQAMFLRQLNLLHRFTLPPTVRFAILEALRGPISDVQEDASKKFAGKPLPFSPPEQAALESTLSVWHMLALGYLRCFDALCADDGGFTSTPALTAHHTRCAGNKDKPPEPLVLAQRTLSVFADWQVDLCRGEQLARCRLLEKAAPDLYRRRNPRCRARAVNPIRCATAAQTSALATYAECNLLSTASPYELPARHLAWVARWAKRWGAKLACSRRRPRTSAIAPCRCGSTWLPIARRAYVPQPSSRQPLAGNHRTPRKSLIARITLLAQGRAPAELQLGDDVTQPAATASCCSASCNAGARAARIAARTAAARNGGCNFIAGFEMPCTSSCRVARCSALRRAAMRRPCAANAKNSRLSVSAAIAHPALTKAMIRRRELGHDR